MLFAPIGALALAALPQARVQAPIQPAPHAPFPFAAVDQAATAGIELAPLSDLFGEIAQHERVLLSGVPLPGAGTVALDLQRVQVVAPDAILWVDGAPAGPLADQAVTSWSGTIAGQRGSHVFLTFAPSGSRGWISGRHGMTHLLAGPDSTGTWSTPTARLISDVDLRAQGHAPAASCLAKEVQQPATPAFPMDSFTLEGTAGSNFNKILQAFVAIESDTQYYDAFGDIDATLAYTLALMGAVSDRYYEDVGVVLTISHLALYTDSAVEPWTAGDNGGSCIDQLFEYQDATIAGDVEARGDLFTFLSGANFGCGVAYLPGLCDDDYKFSVCGNLEGILSFPVEQGPLNWDFIVTAHELGHNFGAPHTHDWCPQPLDECAPDWAGFGQCQDEQLCLVDANIMSYCHLCPGGYENINLHFHRQSIQAMRLLAQTTCLEEY